MAFRSCGENGGDDGSSCETTAAADRFDELCPFCCGEVILIFGSFTFEEAVDVEAVAGGGDLSKPLGLNSSSSSESSSSSSEFMDIIFSL